MPAQRTRPSADAVRTFVNKLELLDFRGHRQAGRGGRGRVAFCWDLPKASDCIESHTSVGWLLDGPVEHKLL